MDEHNTDKALKDILEALELAVKFGIPAEDEFEQGPKIAFNLCKTLIETRMKMNALGEAQREETEEEFNRSYQTNTKPVSKSSVTQSARYKKFMVDLAEIKERHALAMNRAQLHNMEDANNQSETDEQQIVACGDGVEMDMQITSGIDPITKKPLEKPVRNRHCNHVYGMDSVAHLLQVNPRQRCLIMGCVNKQFIKLTDLIPDKELARKLYVQRAKAANQQQSQE